MHKTYSQRMLCAKALCFASLRFPRFAFVEQRLACQTLKIIGKYTGEVTPINTGIAAHPSVTTIHLSMMTMTWVPAACDGTAGSASGLPSYRNFAIWLPRP